MNELLALVKENPLVAIAVGGVIGLYTVGKLDEVLDSDDDAPESVNAAVSELARSYQYNKDVLDRIDKLTLIVEALETKVMELQK